MSFKTFLLHLKKVGFVVIMQCTDILFTAFSVLATRLVKTVSAVVELLLRVRADMHHHVLGQIFFHYYYMTISKQKGVYIVKRFLV